MNSTIFRDARTDNILFSVYAIIRVPVEGEEVQFDDINAKSSGKGSSAKESDVNPLKEHFKGKVVKVLHSFTRWTDKETSTAHVYIELEK